MKLSKTTLIGIVFLGLAFAVVTFQIIRRDQKLAVLPEAASITRNVHYVALGDSVAAGDGLPTPLDSSACNRSKQAYPTLVARSQKLELTNLACSGATVQSGLLETQLVNEAHISPQVDQLIHGSKPSLITLTIGANDVNWTGTLLKCVQATCGDESDTQEVTNDLLQLSSDLTSVFSRLQAVYSPSVPRIELVGYYQLFTVSGCDALSSLSPDESSWWQQQVLALNKTLSGEAAKYTFVHFVAPDFTGHSYCDSDSWIQDLSAKAPFHPTDQGQQAIAKAVEADLAKK